MRGLQDEDDMCGRWTCSPEEPDYDSQETRQSRLKPTLNLALGGLPYGWG